MYSHSSCKPARPVPFADEVTEAPRDRLALTCPRLSSAELEHSLVPPTPCLVVPTVVHVFTSLWHALAHEAQSRGSQAQEQQFVGPSPLQKAEAEEGPATGQGKLDAGNLGGKFKARSGRCLQPLTPTWHSTGLSGLSLLAYDTGSYCLPCAFS